jgi:hypothetical protein
MSRRRKPLPFKEINSKTLERLEALCKRWFCNGVIIKREFCVGSLKGEKGKSLKINLTTGKWCDFATGHRGKDPISLVAAMENCRQIEAAKKLADCLGVPHD